ncbi:MAG TPA: ribosome maturation factor RimM, partial [Myxococcales bacterium]|nr:ribosome maturation factor RimM [Myxococcales bacterium]
EVGYVARAHGLAGEVGVRTFDPASRALLEVERALLRLKDGSELELQIDSTRETSKDLLVGFEGVEDRTRADGLVGATVYVFREDLEPPGEDEVFQGDLVGLKAQTESGEPLGEVAEVWSSGEVPNLVIRAPGREELMVPFAADFVVSVDVAEGRIVIRPPVLT